MSRVSPVDTSTPVHCSQIGVAYPTAKAGSGSVAWGDDRKPSTTTVQLPIGANVYLSSAELAAVCSLLGRIPTVEEYMQYAATIDQSSADTYRYLNFNQLESYQAKADKVV